MNKVMVLDQNLVKEYTLVVKIDENGEVLSSPQPFVVAWLFDPKTKTWAQGHYFHNLKSAVDFLYQ